MFAVGNWESRGRGHLCPYLVRTVLLNPPWTLFSMVGLFSQLPGRDGTCRHCESELSQGILLGIFSAFVVLYKLLAYVGHPGQATEPSIKMKQNPLPSCGPLVIDSGSAYDSEELKALLGRAQPSPNSWSLRIPISKIHPSNFHLLPP